jgi:hypothetical protein
VVVWLLRLLRLLLPLITAALGCELQIPLSML